LICDCPARFRVPGFLLSGGCSDAQQKGAARRKTRSANQKSKIKNQKSKIKN
jgi:hypothetical protein